jgi:hypothetical protein
MTKDSSELRHEKLIAIAMSGVLFLTVGGFIYLAIHKSRLVEPHGFAGCPLILALFLYLVTETNIAIRIRMPGPVRRQLTVWTAWLAILGFAPALDPQRVPQLAIALGAGPLIAIFSIKSLVIRTGQGDGGPS